MKKCIVILTMALVSQFATAQKVAPPPPPPPPPAAPGLPPLPPLPPISESLSDTTKPLKVRTKRIEVIVDGNTRTETTTEGDDDVNIKAGDKKIIIRKRKKTDGDNGNADIQIGDKKIIIKKGEDVRVENGDGKEEKIMVRKQKSADGKTETITIDTDEMEKTIEDAMAALEKEMDALEKQMDGKEKEMDKASERLEKAKTPAETEAANKEVERIGNEMGEIGGKMGEIGGKMGEIGGANADAGKDAADASKRAAEKAHKHHNNGRAKIKNRFVMFDFGVNGLMQNGGFNLKDQADDLEVLYGKSTFYRIGAFQQRIPFDKRGHANLMWGIDFEFDNIELARPVTLKNTNPLAIVSDGREFCKNRLYTSWLDVPVSFQFQTNRKSSKGFRIGVGGFGGLRLAALQDQETKDNKGLKTELTSNINQFRYGAQVNIGSGPINLVARYATSPFFLAGKGPDVNAFNIGISVIPF
jgi:hypothetical protein